MKYIKPIYYDTTLPYKTIEHTGIQYTTCRDFNAISRYKGLRQVIHGPNESDRFVTLETMNAISSNAAFRYYTVPLMEENRLDLISNKFYGTPLYSWVISYFNNIPDGYTVLYGTKLKIISNFYDLFNTGEMLASIPATKLQLGSE